MATIKQHRPAYFSGFDNEEKSFSSLEELLNIEFVNSFKLLPNGELNPDFHQYSISKEQSHIPNGCILMAEYKKGLEWWVIGYINDNEIIKELPIWKPKP